MSAARSSTPKSALPLPDFFTELQITYTYIPSLFLIFPFPFVFIFTSLYSILFYSIDETTSNAFFLHTPYSILHISYPGFCRASEKTIEKIDRKTTSCPISASANEGPPIAERRARTADRLQPLRSSLLVPALFSAIDTSWPVYSSRSSRREEQVTLYPTSLHNSHNALQSPCGTACAVSG